MGSHRRTPAEQAEFETDVAIATAERRRDRRDAEAAYALEVSNKKDRLQLAEAERQAILEAGRGTKPRNSAALRPVSRFDVATPQNKPEPETEPLTPPPVDQTPLYEDDPLPPDVSDFQAPDGYELVPIDVPISEIAVPDGYELVPVEPEQQQEQQREQQNGGLDPLTLLLFSMLFGGGDGGGGIGIGGGGLGGGNTAPTSFTPWDVPESDLGSVPGGGFNNFGSFNDIGYAGVGGAEGGSPLDQMMQTLFGGGNFAGGNFGGNSGGFQF